MIHEDSQAILAKACLLMALSRSERTRWFLQLTTSQFNSVDFQWEGTVLLRARGGGLC